MHSRLSLGPDVHACRVGQAYVFLDAPRDRYLFFRSRQAAWLQEISTAGAGAPISDEAVRFAGHLQSSGLLTDADDANRPIPTEEARPPARSGKAAADLSPRLPAPALWLRMVLLYLRWAHVQDTRRRDLPTAFRVVRSAKQIAASRPSSAGAEAARRLSGEYHAMAPFLFSIHDACFFRSFLLVLFLARHGVVADWVFGVRLSPFGAHCWVSFQDEILNEDPDVAGAYSTILSV